MAENENIAEGIASDISRHMNESYLIELLFKQLYVYDDLDDVIFTKYPKSVPYSDVCPDKPPFVPSAIVGLLEELEKRIPPLLNFRVEKTARYDKAESNVDTLLTYGNSTYELPAYMRNDNTHVLVQTLLLFLQRLSRAPFSVSIDLIFMILKKTYSVEPQSHMPLLEKTLISIFNTLSQQEVSIVSYFMAKIGLFMRMNSSYEMRRNRQLELRDIHCESTSFLSSLFGPYLIHLPASYARTSNLNGKCSENQTKCLIFKILSGGIHPTLWHELSINIYDKKFERHFENLMVILPTKRAYSSRGVTWH